MTIDLDVVCDSCQQSIMADGETYCDNCWNDTIAILPRVEAALRELADTLEGDIAVRIVKLADRIYDWNITPSA